MTISWMIFTVSVLVVISIIMLTKALIRVSIRAKKAPPSIVLFVSEADEPIEYFIKKLIKKYPHAKITVHCSDASDEALKILGILQREYPYITLQA